MGMISGALFVGLLDAQRKLRDTDRDTEQIQHLGIGHLDFHIRAKMTSGKRSLLSKPMSVRY